MGDIIIISGVVAFFHVYVGRYNIGIGRFFLVVAFVHVFVGSRYIGIGSFFLVVAFVVHVVVGGYIGIGRFYLLVVVVEGYDATATTSSGVFKILLETNTTTCATSCTVIILLWLVTDAVMDTFGTIDTNCPAHGSA